MKNLVWVGIRESEVKYSDFIKDSISIFGNTSNSLQRQKNININHNNKENFTLIDEFYNKEIIKRIEKNPNIRFMYYSQIYSYDNMKELGLLNHIVCLNEQKLIEFMNNKFIIKRYLKKHIPLLNYILMKGKDIDLKNIKQKYGNNDFVVQAKDSSGGANTIILNEYNKNSIELNENQTYMITKYCKRNIPVNIHVLVSENNITLLPPSVQIIEILNNKLIYKGSDFIIYKQIVDNNIDKKLKQYANIVGKLMQKKGYRGIFGIDSIIYENEVYFMEINPRFQNSSTILNKALQENNLPSLQELNYNCFYNESIEIKHFDVNYSSYINENGINKEFKIKPIEILDEFNEEIKYEDSSYSYTNIYRESIVEREKLWTKN